MAFITVVGGYLTLNHLMISAAVFCQPTCHSILADLLLCKLNFDN